MAKQTSEIVTLNLTPDEVECLLHLVTDAAAEMRALDDTQDSDALKELEHLEGILAYV